MRRLVDPKKAAIVDAAVEAGAKTEMPLLSTSEPGSIDSILKQQLAGLDRLTKHLVGQISAGNITKETPQQLATCIKVTMELKAAENELLESMSDEELEKKADDA